MNGTRPYITASIKGSTLDEAIEGIKAASELSYVQLIETRFDCFDEPASVDMKKLLTSSAKPMTMVFTVMPDWEGGFFKGSEEERINYIKEAIKIGVSHYHIELKSVREYLGLLEELRSYSDTAKEILSFHDFSGIPQNLEEIFDEMASKSPSVAKIALRPKTADDVERASALHDRSDVDKIIIAMGELGKETRIDRRNYITFGPLYEKEATAPGQLTVEGLAKELGRV